jgi:hypothetical protein
MLLLPALLLRNIFTLIRSCLLLLVTLRSTPTSLAPSLSFLLALWAQTTRLRLKHLNKLCCGPAVLVKGSLVLNCWAPLTLLIIKKRYLNKLLPLGSRSACSYAPFLLGRPSLPPQRPHLASASLSPPTLERAQGPGGRGSLEGPVACAPSYVVRGLITIKRARSLS